jgi:tRNA/rRNA methyltransferase
VILVEPQLGENIGFAARAMANFGLSELRLVAPSRWLAERQSARRRLLAPIAIIDAATVYPSLAAAIGDLTFLLATTARPRGMVKACADACRRCPRPRCARERRASAPA